MDPRITRAADAVAAIFEAAWARLDADRAAGVDVARREAVLDDIAADLAVTPARLRRVAALAMVPAVALRDALEALEALTPSETVALRQALEARAAGEARS